VILGKEVAGVVAVVGLGGDPALVGTRILASTAGTGGYAEVAAVPSDGVVPVPAGLDVQDALALYRCGATAQGLVAAARKTGC
jgi:NADPH2:quinone reductase